MDEAKKALNFVPALPAYIPEGFILDDISVWGNDFLQLIYKDKDDNKLSFALLSRSFISENIIRLHTILNNRFNLFNGLLAIPVYPFPNDSPDTAEVISHPIILNIL